MFESACRIIRILKEHGHEAFIVGGAVRDICLGGEPEDYDIVTTASPVKIQEIAVKNGWKVYNVGKSFQVIMVIIDGKPFEIAMARATCCIEKSTRLDSLRLPACIKEDLSQRDFTINAMAMGLDGEILDPFGGKKDLASGLIRMVGDVRERFKEDALRMFRVGRFIARYGFKADDQIYNAIPNFLQNVKELSVERIRCEIEKILLAPKARLGLEFLVQTGLADTVCRHRRNGIDRPVKVLPELARLVGVPQNVRYHRFDVWVHTLETVSGVPANLTLRWAALLHDIAKGLPGIRGLNKRGEISDHGHDKAGAKIAGDILARLWVATPVRKRVVWLVRNHMIAFPHEENAAKWLKRIAKHFSSQEQLSEAVLQLMALRRADVAAKGYSSVSQVLEALVGRQEALERALETIPFYPEGLNISGGRVAAVLGEGPQVGKFMSDLLDRVIAGRIPNCEQNLFAALARRAKRVKHLTNGEDLRFHTTKRW